MKYRLAIVLLAFVAACGDSSDKRRINIRFIHAVPDGVAVDIWIEGKTPKLFQEVEFSTATSFVALQPGTYNFQLRLALSPESDPVLVETGDLDLDQRGDTFTVIFGGLTSAPAVDPNELRLSGTAATSPKQHDSRQDYQSNLHVSLPTLRMADRNSRANSIHSL